MTTGTPTRSAAELDARNATWHGGMLDRYRLRSVDTDGAAWLMEHEAAAGTGPPLHIHQHEDELSYVIEGELVSYLDGQERSLTSGMAAWLPRGVPHTFQVVSSTARFLTFGSPGGFDQFFRDAGDPASDMIIPPAPEAPTPELLAAAERFGIQIVGPPPA